MGESNRRSFSDQPFGISFWFLLDAIIALAPPLHWSVDRAVAPILGLPAAVLYFVATGLFICASIVAASWAEARSGTPER